MKDRDVEMGFKEVMNTRWRRYKEVEAKLKVEFRNSKMKSTTLDD